MNRPLFRWLALGLMFALGCVYIGLFAFFSANSVNFVVAELNATARARAAQTPFSGPVTLDFRTDVPRSLLGAGWHQPEEVGVWSGASSSWLYLGVPAAAQSLQLRVSGRLSGQPSFANGLTVAINGTPAGRWTSTTDGQAVDLEIALTPQQLATGLLELTMTTDATIVPRQAGGGTDNRALGFLLEEIELAPGAT